MVGSHKLIHHEGHHHHLHHHHHHHHCQGGIIRLIKGQGTIIIQQIIRLTPLGACRGAFTPWHL
eukprot:5022294-Karenia_brevis.AAC.1